MRIPAAATARPGAGHDNPRQFVPRKNDKYHEIPITQHFAAASRGDAPRPVVQFRRRWRNPADAHGLRHLHRRLQNTGRESRGDGLEKRHGTLHAHRRHERRLGALGLRGRRHGLRGRLRTAARRGRGETMGERHPEIHPRKRRRKLLCLCGHRRPGQCLYSRQRRGRRRPDGQGLEGRHGALRLFGEPRHLAGQGHRRHGQQPICRRQPEQRHVGADRPNLEKRQGALHAQRRQIRCRGQCALPRRTGPLRRRQRRQQSPRMAGRRPALHAHRRQFLRRSDRPVPHRKQPVRRRLLHGRLRGRGRGLEKRAGIFRPLRRTGQRLPALCDRVYGGDIFTAGTLFGTTRTAVVWHGEDIRYTLTDGSGHGEAYSMYVVPRYD